ncbi:ribonuclease Y [Streptococcaceae bacterium ESL0729]|nr:ribonuclease Y [Streptococcaceae bacterium ESL0729]
MRCNKMVGVIAAILCAVIGLIAGFILRNIHLNKDQLTAETLIESAESKANDLILAAKRDAENTKNEARLVITEEGQNYRLRIEKEFEENRQELKKQEDRLKQREALLDRKDDALTQKELNLDSKEDNLKHKTQQIKQREREVEKLDEIKQETLEQVAKLSTEEARDIVLKETEGLLTRDLAQMVRASEVKATAEADKRAKDILALAMQRVSGDFVSEQTVSVVTLPNDEMKGRIIGREGRNIRAFESLTGIDVIIDDTPEAVVLSGFDPIRREIARLTLEQLVQDGRIHPARIEELVEKNRKEIDKKIVEYGEQAAFEVGAHTLHPDIIKIMGRLHFRTSYGQNVLNHSIEVANLSGALAGEMGENIALAKRAGFLHDIGKALDHEIEGSHVEIGVELAKKYKENPVVINTIASHHGDTEPTSVIALLVAAADALSAARPGARRESIENYIKRLQKLEEISNDFDGVDSSFAIQAGREIRVLVNPGKINDDQAVILSHKIKQKIEEDMDYPGNIKVTVIRETRAIDYAK